MSIAAHDDNLQRLLAQINPDLVSNPVPPNCTAMANSLPLAHAMTSDSFRQMAAAVPGTGRKLFSPEKLAEAGVGARRPESAEAALGTESFVFFFCGQFRYPDTQAGFFFATSLETERADASEASPFDSGALHRKAEWPDAAETATSFLARHSLSVPAYREYLAQRLHRLFSRPEDYVAPDGQLNHPDPIGLRPTAGGATPDCRLWTFEVRVLDEVELSTPHLAAVFYPARLMGDRQMREFLVSQDTRIHLDEITPGEDGDFTLLQQHGLAYLRNQGMVA